MDVQEETVEEVRAFNRFYTAWLGVLDERRHAGDHTPAELRVLHELAHRRGLTAGQLGRELRLDRRAPQPDSRPPRRTRRGGPADLRKPTGG